MWTRPRLPNVVIILCVLCLLSGCAKEQPVRERQLGQPLVDVNKGGGSLPMQGARFPDTIEELRTSLLSSYAGRLLLPDLDQTIQVEGRKLSHLQNLTMDVSNARIRKGFQPSQFEGAQVSGPRVQVDHLAFIAWPLVFETANLGIRMEAYDVPMRMMRDKKGQCALVMLGAKEGRVEVAINAEDLHKSFVAALKRGGESVGAVLQSADLSLSTPTDQSLEVQARIQSRWLLMPVTFRVHGLMTVDDRFRVSFSQLRCEGEDPMGMLVAAFMDGRMKKGEEQMWPLMRFGDGRTHVRSFKVSTEDGLYLTLGFGH